MSDEVRRARWPDGTEASAIFDSTKRYRYWLERVFPAETSARSAVTFIMLNPSTADALKNDPTVERCSRFAKLWGFRRLIVVNLFALRATDPKELYAADDPIGLLNDEFIAHAATQGSAIAAWGCHGKFRSRGEEVARRLGKAVRCLGRTKDGYPKHPLYLKATTMPEPFA